MGNSDLLTHSEDHRKSAVRFRFEFDLADHQAGGDKCLDLAIVSTSTEEGRITLDLRPKDFSQLSLDD